MGAKQSFVWRVVEVGNFGSKNMEMQSIGGILDLLSFIPTGSTSASRGSLCILQFFADETTRMNSPPLVEISCQNRVERIQAMPTWTWWSRNASL